MYLFGASVTGEAVINTIKNIKKHNNSGIVGAFIDNNEKLQGK